MSISLKPIDQQVIVITGASSGNGVATAESAARKGAKLVLAARSEQTLNEIVRRINEAGGEAIAVVCDVASREQVERVADAAVKRFDRIDTWINDAGVSICRLFDTNFWGVVNGSLAALPHLKRHGGALINVGSEVSEAVVPLMGFNDALRAEIEDIDKAPPAAVRSWGWGAWAPGAYSSCRVGGRVCPRPSVGSGCWACMRRASTRCDLGGGREPDAQQKGRRDGQGQHAGGKVGPQRGRHDGCQAGGPSRRSTPSVPCTGRARPRKSLGKFRARRARGQVRVRRQTRPSASRRSRQRSP